MTKEQKPNNLFLESSKMPEHLSDAMIAHGELLDQLRNSGVANMIEDAVGLPIPNLVRKDKDGKVVPLTILQSRPTSRTGNNGEKWYLKSLPKKLETGSYSDVLTIEAQHVHNPHETEAGVTAFDTESFTIEFGQDRRLKLIGEELYFDGHLPEKPTSYQADLLKVHVSRMRYQPKKEGSIVLASLA